MCCVNEGIIPLDCKPRTLPGSDDDDPVAQQLQEERRLLYVAMSRAKRELQLSYSAMDPTGSSAMMPSRFLKEIGSTFIEKSQQYEVENLLPRPRVDHSGSSNSASSTGVGFVSAKSLRL